MVRKKKLKTLADLMSKSRSDQRSKSSSLPPPPPVCPIVFPASSPPLDPHQSSTNYNGAAILSLLSDLEVSPSEAIPVSGITLSAGINSSSPLLDKSMVDKAWVNTNVGLTSSSAPLSREIEQVFVGQVFENQVSSQSFGFDNDNQPPLHSLCPQVSVPCNIPAASLPAQVYDSVKGIGITNSVFVNGDIHATGAKSVSAIDSFPVAVAANSLVSAKPFGKDNIDVQIIDKEPVGALRNNSNNVPASGNSKKWSSLFKTLPRNAGSFIPRTFDMVENNGVMIPPSEVIQAGIDFWSDYLVGFFLDSNLPYSDVKEHCSKAWHVKGGLRVHMDNSMFFFKFSRPEERLRVLSTDPIFITGKPFIITTWSPFVDCAREQVLSISVWAYFSHIPSVLQSLIGLNWLASTVGILKCFDSNTVARENLVYAKALIEITPDRPLPEKIKVRVSEDYDAEVIVHYGWKPPICSSCHSFGHLVEDCPCSSSTVPIPLSSRTSLPRPPIMKWVPKVCSELVAATSVLVPTKKVVVEVAPVGDVIDDIEVRETSNAARAAIYDTVGSLMSVPKALIVLDSAIQPPDEPLVVDESTSPDEPIYWDLQENTWRNDNFDMRFSPSEGYFYRFVSNDDEDLRCLFYVADGDSLVLAKEGRSAERNEALFADDSWDRALIYSPELAIFDPTLAAKFLPYLHKVGEVSGDD